MDMIESYNYCVELNKKEEEEEEKQEQEEAEDKEDSGKNEAAQNCQQNWMLLTSVPQREDGTQITKDLIQPHMENRL